MLRLGDWTGEGGLDNILGWALRLLLSRLNRLLLYKSRAFVIFDNFKGGRVHERMHEAVVNGQHEILEFLVVFESDNLQTHC